MKVLRLAMLMLAALFPAMDAAAMEPEQREVVVISARVWEGHEYREIFVPSTNDGMTLIAGQDSAISFVRTLEYYWPLSRQVYVDFNRQREIVEGELVIRQGGNEIASQPLDVFSIVYPQGAVNGDGSLLWGDDASRAHAGHQEAERVFAREFAAARRAHSQYERQLAQAGAARQRGEEAAAIEPPPPLPQPSMRLVTSPQPGYRLALPPGLYSIVLESHGRAVPGTQRQLRVIEASGSETLVADIVPSERWTRPIASNFERARIFARPGATFYMTLANADLFDEADYLPVINPQAQATAGRPLWVRRGPADARELLAGWSGGDTKAIARDELKVEQTRGTSFGYRVRPAREGERADLNAFVIEVPGEGNISGATISTTDDAGRFLREVVVVQPRRSWPALAMALLPLIIGASWIAFRRFRAA